MKFVGDFWKKYQIIAFHRSLSPDFEASHELIQKLNGMGIVTIDDIDDYWMPTKDHPIHDIIRVHKINEKIIASLKVAKHVTTTTSLFADEISKFHKSVFVSLSDMDKNFANTTSVLSSGIKEVYYNKQLYKLKIGRSFFIYKYWNFAILPDRTVLVWSAITNDWVVANKTQNKILQQIL